MRRKHFWIVVTSVLLLGVIAGKPCAAQTSAAQAQTAPQKSASAATPCDRACLEGFVDQFLDALVAHDPSHLAVTKTVKFTENGQRLELGDGFWRTATARGSYKLYVADTEAGQVGFIGTMREAGQPVLVALRLKIRDRRIAEAELLVESGSMTERGVANLEKLGAPDHIYLEDLPSAQRVSRLEFEKTANKYFASMQLNDGKGDYSFFADDCNRLENGMQTTNNPNFAPPATSSSNTPPSGSQPRTYSAAWSCKDQFQSGLLHFVTRIRDRRFPIVDRERGIVVTFVFFDHAAGNTRTFQTPDGRTVTAGPQTPWTWEICEIFKIWGGQIHRIEAALGQVPYGMGSGWSSWDRAISDQPQW